MSKIHFGEGREDTPIVLMDRVQNVAGANITQATITSIAYRVFEYASEQEAKLDTNGSEVGESATLTKTDVVFDALQTGAPWDSAKDAVGYNFRFTLPSARRPTGNKWHRVEVTFTPSSGEAFAIVWIIETSALAGS